jgi:hypothetical protein
MQNGRVFLPDLSENGCPCAKPDDLKVTVSAENNMALRGRFLMKLSIGSATCAERCAKNLQPFTRSV